MTSKEIVQEVIRELEYCQKEDIMYEAETNLLLPDMEQVLKDLEVLTNNNSDTELENMLNMYYSKINDRDNLNKEIDSLIKKKEILKSNIEEIETLSRQDNMHISAKERTLKELEMSKPTFYRYIFKFEKWRIGRVYSDV